MKTQRIKVVVGNRADMAREFINAWHQAEAGQVSPPFEEKIFFNNEKSLFKTLSPKRCELLRYLHGHHDTTILALAKQLKRDYRNVYQDVKALSQIGLMIKNSKTGKYSVPWQSIVTEISLEEPKELKSA